MNENIQQHDETPADGRSVSNGGLGNVHNILDDMGLACQCGCVKYNLLRSSKIECASCGNRIGSWSYGDPLERLCELLDFCKIWGGEAGRARERIEMILRDMVTPNVDVTGPRLRGSGGQQGSAAPSPSSGD